MKSLLIANALFGGILDSFLGETSFCLITKLFLPTSMWLSGKIPYFCI
tara:strand:- start:154 stop:297 length:144 start_codon:yes stop_codon:yes gene_type:complete